MALLRRAPTLTLDWDLRQKSRFDAVDSAGHRVGVFLPRGTVLRGGDALLTEDGKLLCVVAAPQAVLRITPCAEHGSPFDLTRAAYHLGNRHVPIELRPDHLQIEPDHVLADMLRRMHLTVLALQAPFEPEAGAYGDGGHEHAEAHRSDHDDHAHASAHGRGHTHDHLHAHAHHGHAHGHSASHP